MPDAYARRSVCNPECLMTQRGQGNAWQRAGVQRVVVCRYSRVRHVAQHSH